MTSTAENCLLRPLGGQFSLLNFLNGLKFDVEAWLISRTLVPLNTRPSAPDSGETEGKLQKQVSS